MLAGAEECRQSCHVAGEAEEYRFDHIAAFFKNSLQTRRKLAGEEISRQQLSLFG